MVRGAVALTIVVLVLFGLAPIGHGNPMHTGVPSRAPGIAAAPELVVEKWVVVNGTLMESIEDIDAYDRVDFVINVTNTGGADAYNVTLNDTVNLLNPWLWARNMSNIVVYLDNGTILANGTDYLMIVDPNTSYPYSFNLTLYRPLPSGMSLLINYTVYIHDYVKTGSEYWNRVNVTRYSDAPNGPNLVDPANPPRDSVNVSIKPPLVLSKRVYWSQEDFTGKTGSGLPEPLVAAIGEVLVYEINVSIPEGYTWNLTIDDWLPALYNSSSGHYDIILVEYLNESNITVDDPGVYAANASLIPGVWSSIDGVRLYPNLVKYVLSDTRNTNNDTDDEVVSIRLKAVVLNRPENYAGVWPWNGAVTGFLNATGEYVSPQNTTPPYVQVVIHEPDLTVMKESNTSVLGESGGVSFNLTLYNNNTYYSGPAFDVWAIDPMPQGLVLDTASISVYLRNSTGLYPLAYTSYSTPAKLNVSIDLSRGLLPGESIHVYYNASLDPYNALHGSTINNTGYFIASSLPGPRGTGNQTPGDPGTLLGERIYNESSSLLLSVEPLDLENEVDKATATIGEDLTYTINITVPMGSSYNVTVVVELDPGTQYLGPVSCTIIGSGITVDNCPPATSLAGNTLTLSLGNVTKTTPGYGYILLNYPARVLDEPFVVSGYTIVNNATLYYNNLSPGHHPELALTLVVEPSLAVDKWFDPSFVTHHNVYTSIYINVSNNGTSPAYDVRLQDLVPSEILVLGASIVAQHNATGAALYLSGNNVTLTVSSIGVRGYVLLQVDARAYAGTPWNASITNTAEVNYTSLPGRVAGERSYTSSGTGSMYYDPVVAGVKTMEPRSIFIGGTIISVVNVTIPTGYTTNLTIIDRFDPPLSPDLATLSITHPPSITTGTPSISLAGDTIVINLGRVANNATSPENITITLSFNVNDPSLDGPGGARGRVFNNATIQWVDNGLSVERSLGISAYITLAPIVGGDAVITTGAGGPFSEALGLAAALLLLTVARRIRP
ncbi:MAG: isopeptide-forming domain-containing fimbrial protein [Desulfurococcales archaeon]|nr:isopeptide-forming domain-containing fimbrial protein [Desulfurococcales archaeon]